MATKRNIGQSQSVTNSILRESMKYGSLVTLFVMAVLSFGVVYLIYGYLLSGWTESIPTTRETILKKEIENKKTENMLAQEVQFTAKFNKIVSLYDQAKPLLPEETEVSDVLGQVEVAARKNGVTLAGLTAVKESVKSPKSEKVYEREIPAVVNGTYPQVAAFFAEISRMPRILMVRDYSIVALKSGVSAGFTLVAYHAPPPSEKPAPATTAADNNKPPEANNAK